MRTIAIINQKGGCGKTTTAINLSASLARRGRRVLLVDMDPQSHCAAGLGIPEGRIELDIGDAMLAGTAADPARLLWRAGRNLDLAPSRMRLAGLEAARGGLADMPDREKRLAGVLREFRAAYDVACIDCPPSIGLLTYNALAAADLVLIPVETSFFSLQGATKQVSTVKTLARRLGVQLPVWLLPTLHEAESDVSADLLREMMKRFQDRVLPVTIRRDSRLREAASFGQPAADYAPQSWGAGDYAALAGWVEQHLGPRVESPEGPESAEAMGEVHVPPISARVLAERGAGEPAMPEAKPLNRAEDVARRAQEFLRRVAMGRQRAGDAGATSSPTGAAASEGGLPPGVTMTPAHPVPPPRSGLAPGARVPLTTALRLTNPEARATPVSASTPRLFGVRETNQGVLFVQPLSAGASLAVAGTFNHWSPTQHAMRANHELGVWELCVRLPAGPFQYRIVTDGVWAADPYNDHCEPNPFGEVNSVFCVGASRAGVPA